MSDQHLELDGTLRIRKILAIDGGGIKGVFPASFLATLQESLSSPIVDYFDLVVGTSTGGIIALGLGLGLAPRELVDFYSIYGPSIFRKRGALDFMRGWLSDKHDPRPLESALQKAFGDKRLGDSKTRLVIPSTNLDTGEVHIFKTSHHKRLKLDLKRKASDIAMETAAAPTYFPHHLTEKGSPLADGGIWANNPMAVAVIEAIGLLAWPSTRLKLLSIGCTVEPFDHRPKWLRRAGKLYWATKISSLALNAQSSAALGTASLLIGKANIERICPTVPSGKYKLDEPKGIRSLIGLGDTEARKALEKLSVFFEGVAEPFVPNHTLK